jgi:hypothetical protein
MLAEEKKQIFFSFFKKNLSSQIENFLKNHQSIKIFMVTMIDFHKSILDFQKWTKINVHFSKPPSTFEKF